MTSEATTATTAEAPAKKGFNNFGDPVIWGIYISLIFISLIESFSASSQIIGPGTGMYTPIVKHAIHLLLGFCGLLIFFFTNYKKIPYLIAILALVTIVALLLAPIIGQNVNNAKRAIDLGFFSIQPAEMAKISIVALIAWVSASTQRRGDVSTAGITICAALVLFYSALTFSQGLTNTLLLMGISFIMMLISGVKLRKIGIVILVYAFFAGVFFVLKSLNDDKEENLKSATQTEVVVQKPANNDDDILNDDNPLIQFVVKNFGRGGTWVARFIRHYTPPQLVEQEMNQLNQQEMYARMAQANSNNLGIGPIGVGPGNSRECSRLPLAFSDYIYSIIVEELGLAGALFVLVLFVGLIFRAKKLARQCSYAFPSFLVLGMSVMISLQALFHMAINTGVVPVSGQPLPLISMGGTSILMVSAAFGIILSVSRYAIQNSQDKELKKAELNQLPENLRSENPLYTK